MFDINVEMMLNKVEDDEMELSLDSFVDFLWLTEQMPYAQAEAIYNKVCEVLESK